MNAEVTEKKFNSIEKCLQILSIFSFERPKYSLREISEKLNFNLSTTYRILSTLEEYGYVSRLRNKKYVIGTQPIYLSAIYTHSNQLDQIRPIVDIIRDKTGETISFFVEEDSERICLYRAHSRDNLRHNIEQGTRLKLNRGASGRVIMAYGKRGEDKSGFYKDIRDKGFYLSINEHNPSLFAIAVPVISKSNIFVGALVASGPISRFNENKRRLLLNNLRSNLAKVVIP